MRARLLAGGVVLLALVAGGCGGGNAGQGATSSAGSSTGVPGQGSPTGATGSSGASSGTSASASEQMAQALDALTTAAGAVTNGRPFDMEHETENGQQVWEVKVASGGTQHTVYVSLDGRQVVSQREDQKPDDDVQKLQSAKVEAADALRTAAAAEPGARLDELEIDTNHANTVVWEIELRRGDGSEVSFDIDAASGKVLSKSAAY